MSDVAARNGLARRQRSARAKRAPQAEVLEEPQEGGDTPDSVRSRRMGGRRTEIEDFWTIPELAHLLQVSARTVRRWIASGKLVAHRFSPSIVRIADSDFHAFLADLEDD
jgi:excisionase family DNA binding protein